MPKSQREQILEFAKEAFATLPEYLFETSPDTAVLRNKSSGKWYGVIMNVSPRCLGLSAGKSIDIINIKCDPIMLGSLLCERGFYPAYHMNKSHWVTARLDCGVDLEQIYFLLRVSYELTSKKTGTKSTSTLTN